MSGTQTLVLSAKGIHSNNNYYSTPAGSLSEAVNVVCDRTDIIEPRRGMTQYGAEDASQTKQLMLYKDIIIKHYGSKLSYDFNNSGKFVDLTGDAVNEVETGTRLKFVEMNGNFYFTTASGVKKLSALTVDDFASIDIEQSGAIKAVDITVTVDYGSFGFLEPNSKVAYKLVFGKNDINDNLLLGVPSARSVVWNIGTVGCATDIIGILPSDIDETYFYQLYRTGLSTEANPLVEPADPGDEMYLVIENNITSTDISNGYISTADITSEDFRRNGALLYVNPVSGEGILQSNEVPPFCKDMTEYKGIMFYTNTSSVQRLNLAFLTITGITSGVTTFTVTDGVTPTVYTFNGDFETTTYTYSAVATDFYNGAPATAKYFTLASANDERKYLVWFNKNPVNDTEPSISGYINIEVDISVPATADLFMQAALDAVDAFTTDFNLSLNTGTNVLTIENSNNGIVSTVLATTIAATTPVQDSNGEGDEASALSVFLPRTTGANAPDVGSALEQISKSLVKKINANDSLVNAYYLSNSNDIPGQFYLENQIQTGSAFYVQSNAPATPPNSVFNPTVPSSGSTVISTNEVRPNRAYFSKFQQPEAVPLVNYLDIGPKDRAIKRVLGLRDSLFFLKEDAIYRLSGDNPTNFTISPFDSSVQILAPDTAVVLNNQIYALSTQGVVVITDTGVSIISRPIENQILDISRSTTSYKTASFGVAYESDRSYLLWTVSNPNDTVATQCFRYNTFTNTWTKWLGSKTCGLVSFADNRLYMGAGDINIIEQERKELLRADHCDRQYEKSIELVGATNYLILDSLTNLSAGDLLQQRQYLTAQQYNRLLRKLDLDGLVPSTNYYSLLAAVGGSNIRERITSLANKLDADLGSAVNYTNLIANYSYSISVNTVASQTVLTLGAHSIQSGRYVTILGSTCLPSIDGVHKVIAATATTITLNVRVTNNSVPAAGTVSTAISNFKDVQACYNLIATSLNSDVTVEYVNYLLSDGYLDLEETVNTFDRNLSSVDIVYNQTFFVGECTLYKSINSYILYNPQFFDNPSVDKQVRETSLLFENTNFSKIIASYKTDKSIYESSVTITKSGVGDFGQSEWGATNFGGLTLPTPLRTYVPLEKQRCRFIQVKVQHNVAQEKYSLLGLALTYRSYGIRTTK